MTSFRRTDSSDPDFQMLVALLDADLSKRDGSEHSFYAQFNNIQHIRNVIVCYAENVPAGCGAFKLYEGKAVEIKRMFVQPAFRGKGIGLGILAQLEKWALECGYERCVLETGKRQPEAIALYQKAGYQLIKNYGQYEHIENSVCMLKVLAH